jgi:two-component system sensor histidine kinase/response regulator
MVGAVLPSATVLVVDDNVENRALAQATLEDEGYRVVLASDGAVGVDAFRRDRPDCILLDVRMPGTDGLTACEQIRASPGGDAVAIVFVTAQREVETFDRAVAAGGDDFLTKPFRPSELVIRVQAALRARKLAGERSGLYEQVKRQRDDLQRLQLHKEQLTNFLVHDLKNPVSTIELQVQRVLRDPAATDRSRSAANAIRDEARSLMRMILNLLDVSRAEEGRLTPAAHRLDCATVLQAAVDDMQLRATESNVELRAEVSATRIDADPDLVHRVLTNLLENAIRYAPEGTAVTIATRSLDRTTEIRIRDAGPGIPADQRSQVFLPFESGRGTTRENRGLGLAFCKLAVEAHGGTITIEEGAPGAVFCLRFPHVP